MECSKPDLQTEAGFPLGQKLNLQLNQLLLGLVYLGTHVNMRKSPLKLCQPLTLNLERDIFAVKNNADI